MTTSPPQKEESMQNLQTECHYLSMALNRLNPKTADPEEYNFLKQKLQAAEEKLQSAASAAEAVVDDYSYDDNGPASNESAYDSEMQEYYAATNSYRQQLQADARNYGDRKKYKIDDDDDGSSSDDSDDSSVGSAHQHVKRSYRKTILKEKSRDILKKYNAKSKEYYGKGKDKSKEYYGKGKDKSKEYYDKGKEKYRKSKEYCQEKSIKDIDQSSWVKIILIATAFVLVVLSIALRNRPRNDGYNMFQENLGGSNSDESWDCATVSLSLRTDRFGNETSWDIVQKDPHLDWVTLQSGGPYRYGKYTPIYGHTEEIDESICLPVGQYKFILHDKLGDGICCEYGEGKYGLRIIGGREIRPMADGIFLGKEAIINFDITEDDVGVLGSDLSSDSSTGEDDGSSASNSNGDSDEEDVTNVVLTTTSSTTTSSTTTSFSVNDQSSPGVNTDGSSEITDDSDLGLGLDDVLDDGFSDSMGDDNLLSGDDDDLINALGVHTDDAVDPLMYYNIEKMDSNADGKVSKEEFATGSEEISRHCSKMNVQTSSGRSECERVCGTDHDCCFQPTQGGYDCNSDPSYACDTYKPCEILFESEPADGVVDGFNGGVGSKNPTALEMALVEESVHQYCSSNTPGIGLGKCQEICQDHLCCFETNFGVGNVCKTMYQGFCTYYAGCEQMAQSSSNWNGFMNNKPDVTTTVSDNQDEDFLPAVQPLTLAEKLEVQDQVDQACSQNSLNVDSSQCRALCESHMCCFDSSELSCKDYDLMCPFYTSCEMLKFDNRKRLRG